MRMTAEDLARHGVTAENMQVTFDSDRVEFTRRAKQGLPYRAPRLCLGQWVYSHFRGANLRVLSLYWDQGPATCRSFWRASVAGHSSPDEDFGNARDNAPYIEVVETSPGSHCYRDDRIFLAPGGAPEEA